MWFIQNKVTILRPGINRFITCYEIRHLKLKWFFRICLSLSHLRQRGHKTCFKYSCIIHVSTVFSKTLHFLALSQVSQPQKLNFLLQYFSFFYSSILFLSSIYRFIASLCYIIIYTHEESQIKTIHNQCLDTIVQFQYEAT